MTCSKPVIVKVVIALTIVVIAGSASATLYENSRAIAVSGGENHTLVLTADGYVWGCGPNGYYQLGIGDDTTAQKLLVRVHGPNDVNFIDNIISADAGWKHSLAVDVNKHVWSVGDNYYGELGNGDSGPLSYKSTPIQVKSGAQDPGHPNTLLQNIIAVSAGRSGEYSLALDNLNRVWSFGRNDYGQLGDGTTTTPRTTPVAVHAGQQNPENPSAALADIVQISAGERTSVALEKTDANDPARNGRILTWGSNKWPIEGETSYPSGKGKLGNGDITADSCDLPVLVLRGAQPGDSQYLERIVAVSAGWDHMMALEELDPFEPNCLGRVYTFGNNGQGYGNEEDPCSVGGRLGDGTYNDANVPVMVLAGEQNPAEPTSPLKNIVAISAGEAHSMALDYQGHVFCWGDNYFGQLGNGTTDPCTTPVQVIAADTNQPLSGIVAISAAYWHNLAIDVNGTIWTWGKINAGRLGVGETITEELSTAARTINLVQNLTKQNYQFGIQTAIDDASNGNVLEASPGTYFEQIDFGDKSVTLKSAKPVDRDIVEKTTIYGPGSDNGYGYVVKLNGSQSSYISGFKITNADNAIVCDSSTVEVSNCIITGNYYNGIYSLRGSSISVQHCKIHANNWDGITVEGGQALIVNNWIYDSNTYDGIYLYSAATATIRNNTIVNNGLYGIECSSSTANISSCIVSGNTEDNLAGCTADYSFIGGDPCFINPSDPNDYHLDPNSPCIDAGDPAFDDFNETDIDGEFRIMDGDFNGTDIVDIGADELYWPKCDYDKSEIVNFVDFSFFANAWQDYNDTIDLDGDSFVDINDLILFCNDWLWVAPWSARYEQMMMAGGSGGAMAMSSVGVSAAPALPALTSSSTATTEAEPLSAERIEELIDWTESLLKDEERTLDESKIQIILDSLKAELPD